MLSVEQVADRLGLHVRTVRKYIRDGKLGAVRIGKQYRISRSDLEAFTGVEGAGRAERRVEVTSIVQVDAIDRADADRIEAHLQGSIDGRARVESAYDEDRGSLKLIILGDPEAAADLLRLISLLAKP